MPATLACIAGAEIYRQWDSGALSGQELGHVQTPFGDSGCIFRLEPDDGQPFFMLARTGSGMDAAACRAVNHRANIYALKDLGVQGIVGWGQGRAITHTIAVGDIVLLTDVIDQTNQRASSFFESSPLGELRQLPVFCPLLRRLTGEVLDDLKLVYHDAAIAAVREGPRGETPAEIHMLSDLGADLVTHEFLPELFLARELEMAYAAFCCIATYAETGSRHRPLVARELFVDMSAESESQRISAAVGAMGRVASRLADRLAERSLADSPFLSAQQEHIATYNLPDDWRNWFAHR